ncbi:hypothetical protein F3K20_23765 [Streptomyces scabiei]|nr:hypothetical protein F3K20_23765 [Streptomyces sp. LBUM 1482]QTU63480.1 hypothetical protein F3K22_22930 [Streptomyces sp. LBUM 1475]
MPLTNSFREAFGPVGVLVERHLVLRSAVLHSAPKSGGAAVPAELFELVPHLFRGSERELVDPHDPRLGDDLDRPACDLSDRNPCLVKLLEGEVGDVPPDQLSKSAVVVPVRRVMTVGVGRVHIARDVPDDLQHPPEITHSLLQSDFHAATIPEGPE